MWLRWGVRRRGSNGGSPNAIAKRQQRPSAGSRAPTTRPRRQSKHAGTGLRPPCSCRMRRPNANARHKATALPSAAAAVAPTSSGARTPVLMLRPVGQQSLRVSQPTTTASRLQPVSGSLPRSVRDAPPSPRGARVVVHPQQVERGRHGVSGVDRRPPTAQQRVVERLAASVLLSGNQVERC